MCAASLILNGTRATRKTAFRRHDKSYVALLKIDGEMVRKVAQADVGDPAEGIAFSPVGHYLYRRQLRRPPSHVSKATT